MKSFKIPRGNQKPSITKNYTIQWPKKKGQKDKPIVDKELHKKIKIEQYKSTTKKNRV